MSTPESVQPPVWRATTAQATTATQTGTTAARTAATTAGAPGVATSPVGQQIVAALAARGADLNSKIESASDSATHQTDAAEQAITKVEGADERGGARFTGDGAGSLDAKSIEADAQRRAKELTGQGDPTSQAAQVAAQVGQGVVQGASQALQQVGQVFQQIPQQAGQVGQQAAQLMSGVATANKANSEVPGLDTGGTDAPGAGIDPGIDLGGTGGLGGDDFAGTGGGVGGGDTGAGGSDTAPTVGGANIGPAVLPMGGGAPVAVTPTTSTPMGGMPMAPMMGRPGGGGADGTKRSEIVGESPIYDESAQGMPVVEQVIGGIPTIAIEEPSWETTTVSSTTSRAK